MRPRRVTAHAKQLPPVEVVQARMADIQAQIAAGEYQLGEFFNGDESGMIFGAQPKRQYVPLDADRAVSPEGDDETTSPASQPSCMETLLGRCSPLLLL